MNAPILPVSIQLVSLAILLALLGWVLWLIRAQRLHLRESLIWLVTTVAAIAVTAYPQLLVLGARLLGRELRCWVLLGDSEMAEGSVYEALELAGFYGLARIVAESGMDLDYEVKGDCLTIRATVTV